MPFNEEGTLLDTPKSQIQHGWGVNSCARESLTPLSIQKAVFRPVPFPERHHNVHGRGRPLGCPCLSVAADATELILHLSISSREP